MSKIFLALSILSVSAGGFLAARQSAAQFQREASAARGVWITQTQLVAAAYSQQVELTEHVREMRQALGQVQHVEENSLWSALQTNRTVQLTPELRERLLQELGFNWQSSPDFIVITKQSLSEAGNWIFRNDKCSDVEAAVLAMTSEERTQVEAAMLRLQAEFNDWVLAHVERSDATNEVRVKYISPDAALNQSIKRNFEAAVFRALRTNRAEFVEPSARSWMDRIGVANYGYQTSMVIEREVAGNQQRLKAEIKHFNPGEIRLSPEGIQSGYLPECKFPDAFRCSFPNGWADVAEREGFELPKEAQKK